MEAKITFPIDVDGVVVQLECPLDADVSEMVLAAKLKVSQALNIAGTEGAVCDGYVAMRSKNDHPCIVMYSSERRYSRHKFVTIYEQDERFKELGIDVPFDANRLEGSPLEREKVIRSGHFIPISPVRIFREVKIGDDGNPEKSMNGYMRRYAGFERLGQAQHEQPVYPPQNGSEPPPEEEPVEENPAKTLWDTVKFRVNVALAEEEDKAGSDDYTEFLSLLTNGESLKKANVAKIGAWDNHLSHMDNTEIRDAVKVSREQRENVNEEPTEQEEAWNSIPAATESR